MNFYELKRKDNDIFPALLLEKILPKGKRKIVRKILYYAMVVAFFGVFFTLFISEASSMIFMFRALFIIFFSVWFTLYLFELMYLSYYFKDTKIDFEVLKLVNSSEASDITKSFVNSELGSYALIRLGITGEKIKEFLDNRTDFVTEAEYEIIENNDDEVTFAEFGQSLVHFDSDFLKLLKEHGVTVADFKETLEWVSRISKRIRNSERWWTNDRLLRFPSIGKSWSFGQIYYLDRFGHSIYTDPSYYHLGDKWRLHVETVNEMENILGKDDGGNIMLTSRETDTGMSIVASLGKEIVNGTVSPKVEGKRIYVLDVNSLIFSYEDRSQFEIMLQRILQQSANAGDVILKLRLKN